MLKINVLASSSRGNCIEIDDGTTRILLDAGIPFKEIQRKLDFNLSSVVGCFVSHEHLDHSRAVKDLVKASVDCWMLSSVRHSLGLVNHHRAHTTQEGDRLRVGYFELRPFGVVHSNTDGSECENLGFLIITGHERAVYIVDTAYSRYRFDGLTHVMIECNFSKATLNPSLDPSVKRRLYRNHFRLENVIRFLKANDLSQVKQIFLLHLSSSNSDAEMFKREVQSATGKPVFVGGE